MCAQEAICVPRFLAIFLKHPVGRLVLCKDFPSLMNEGRFPHVGDSIFFCLPLLAENSLLGPVHMIPGQFIALGQLTDPGVNFASVHGLTCVTVHMNYSWPRGNFERRLTRCTTPGNRPCQDNFSPCEQT